MFALLAASLLWAFSFGLIKGELTAGLDPFLVSLVRLALAAAAFGFLVVRSRHHWRLGTRAMGLGAIQFGLMYVLYIASYRYLPAWMVALFTVTTPFYVMLLAAIRERSLPPRYVTAVTLAIAGALVVVARGLPDGASWTGGLLLQGANLCFAIGQVFFADLKRESEVSESTLVAWMYLGALLVPAVALLLQGNGVGTMPDSRQWLTLLYLGLLPTALGFYLWNLGAARVQPGFLASLNNLKVPLAVIVSWTIFGEEADYVRFLLGLVLVVAALFVAGSPRMRDGQKSS
ncbi:MAG: EamA family transporter [Myxococcales bacterium]|nr:EamA family transporter [Myxococcales bacterium]